MPIVAIAFHGTIAISKLKAHYESPAASMANESRTVFCPNCSLTFVAVIVNGADPHKEEQLDNLRKIIEEDCINGLHQEEYVLEERRLS